MKLLLRLLSFFRRTDALLRQILTFPQLFRFCSDLGNPGIFVSVMFTIYTQEYIICSSLFGCVFFFIAPEKRFGRARHIQTSLVKCLGNPTNSFSIHTICRRTNSRPFRQTLPHPYSPLKNHTVFRINRKPGLGI